MSSSSPTSSIPPLPAELILRILELAYPPHAEDDYTGRSRDVLPCCLVSKQWKEVAEPVLWRSVTVTRREQVDQLAQQPPEKRDLTRNLALHSSSVSDSPPPHVPAALRLLPAAEHVRVSIAVSFEVSQSARTTGPVPLSYFECLSHLRSLGLAGPQYYHVDTALLPRLQAFSLPNFTDYNNAPTLVSSATIPSLRHLGPTSSALKRTLSACATSSTLSRSMPAIPGVSTLSSSTLSATSSSIWRRQSSPTANFLSASPPAFPTLRVTFASSRLPSPGPPSTTSSSFHTAPKPSSSPVLPPCSTDAPATDDSTRDAFLKRCKDEGIEVHRYRPVKEKWREVGCREFREYVEERKIREVAV